MANSETSFTYSTSTFDRILDFSAKYGASRTSEQAAAFGRDLSALLQAAMADAQAYPAVTITEDTQSTTYCAVCESEGCGVCDYGDPLDDGPGHRENYLSPNIEADLPGYRDGFWTVIGWLRTYRPDLLENMDETPDATQRDGWWLKHQARKRGMNMLKVAAPLVLREDGITEVNAYPGILMRERFGD